MKKTILFIFLALLVIGITGCQKEEKKEDGKKFKKEYESFNDKSNEYFEYRDIEIDEDNPIIYSTAEEIVKKIDNKDTFIVYFGDPECPWCRSVIEQAIKMANENDIDKIYYVRFWDGFHKEKIRDTYELDDENKPVLKEKGTEAYSKLLKKLDNVLSDYMLKDKDKNTIEVNEKRIFLPNFVYVSKGKAKELVDGISKKQESYNAELTDEVIKDEKKTFDNFFSKYKK